MYDAIMYVAQEAGSHPNLPLQSGNPPLLPKPYDLVWSIVCTAIVLVIFWKKVLPAYNRVLAEREERIAGGIERAERAQEEAKAALEKYNAKLAGARDEAAQIREEARDKGKQIVAEHKVKAQAEADRIIAAGEKQLAASREQVVAELRRDLGQSSITLAEKLIGEELDDKTKRSKTIDTFLSTLDDVTHVGK